jgi:putative spermidine/putrescine transport system substrate-binding protein
MSLIRRVSPYGISAFLAGFLLMVGLASAADALRVLAWPGYADEDMVRAFEKRFNARVEVTIVSTDDALREKLAANRGGDFDVFAANTAEISRLVERDLIAPLDLSRMPRTREQLPRFRNLAAIPGITRDGLVFAVPYTYSEMGLIYARAGVKEIPASMAALWDPRYRGRVLAYDGSSHNFTLAALMLGIRNPFRLSDAEFKRVTEHLVALRRNALAFYSLPEESAELFRHDGGVLLFANYGAQQVKLLRDEGADIGYVIPKEGALAWLDCWAVTRGARDKRLAESWINYTLEKPVSTALTERQGLANTITATLAERDRKLIWLEPVEDAPRRASLWNRIMSGELPGKF